MAGQFGKLLMGYRTRIHRSKVALADDIGTSATALYNWETGKEIPPPLTRVRSIAVALGLNDADAGALLHAAATGRESPESLSLLATALKKPSRNPGAPQLERRKSVPLYGDIPAGPPESVAQASEVYEVLSHQAGQNRYVLRVNGDSMMGDLRDGDLLLMEYVSDPQIEHYNNRICAVLLDGESTLKRVQCHTAGEHTIVILKGDRPDYPTDTFVLGEREFAIQGVALEIVSRKLA